MLGGEIELFGVGRAEVRVHRGQGAEWIVRNAEVDGLQRREAIADARSDVDVARRNRDSGAEWKLAEQAQTAAFAAGRIIEYAKTATHHGVRE